MPIANGPEVVPRDAEIITLGLSLDNFDAFQHTAKHRLRRKHAGWECVVDRGESFSHLVDELLPSRLEFDILFITNDMGLPHDELRAWVTHLTCALAAHPSKPWVVLDKDVMRLKQFFESRCINVHHASIADAMEARYEKKCEAAKRAAA